MNPELPSQAVIPLRNVNSFGPWDRDLSLIKTLQVLTVSHKDQPALNIPPESGVPCGRGTLPEGWERLAPLLEK